jgi:tetratricopeptide (TPR) repeat protein
MGAGEGERPAAQTSARTSPTSSGQPPDLSTMTPREAAIRLFNRVMMADEQGNADEVAQFAPMAIAAYDRVENLDLEAIYHIGLINAAAGDPEKAWEVVERLRAVVPEHLLASVLEHRLATEENDQAKAERAIERFKAAYDEEIKVDRREYRGHQRQIDQFRQTLGAASGGS